MIVKELQNDEIDDGIFDFQNREFRMICFDLSSAAVQIHNIYIYILFLSWFERKKGKEHRRVPDIDLLQ